MAFAEDILKYLQGVFYYSYWQIFSEKRKNILNLVYAIFHFLKFLFRMSSVSIKLFQMASLRPRSREFDGLTVSFSCVSGHLLV